MQREIEALLKAYVEDRQREGKLVTELLTALAVGAASRRQMMEDITLAVAQIGVEAPLAAAPVEEPAAYDPPYDPVTEAVSQLRSVRDMSAAH
jgi:hypothetical protein